MKKLLAMLCMITCIFGLTACGSEKPLTSEERSNIETAGTIAKSYVVPYLSGFFDDATAEEYLDKYNKDEMKYIAETVFYNVLSQNGASSARIYVDGSGFLSGITSFNSAHDAMGDLIDVGEPAAEISGDEIIVSVPVIGTVKDATAEIIFSNDLFLTVKACALNVETSMGEMMGRAGLNTLMGMGTVFVVLILISLLISALGIIPKLQAKFRNKNKKEELQAIKTEAVDNTIAQIIEKEELSDDLELVAVIAAAIAASEGRASTDGFVVRSIRKVRR